MLSMIFQYENQRILIGFKVHPIYPLLTFTCLPGKTENILGEKKHWTVCYTSPQTFQPLIVIYIGGHFVHYHWGFTSIYRPVSYPFRSLENISFILKLYFTERAASSDST